MIKFRTHFMFVFNPRGICPLFGTQAQSRRSIVYTRNPQG